MCIRDRVKNIIAALDNAILSDDMDLARQGYSFDDGQTKVQTNFRSLSAITKAIEYYEKRAYRLSLICNGSRIYTAREMRLR